MAGEKLNENGHLPYSLDGAQKGIMLCALDYAILHIEEFAAHYRLSPEVCEEDLPEAVQLIKDATGLTLLPRR